MQSQSFKSTPSPTTNPTGTTGSGSGVGSVTPVVQSPTLSEVSSAKKVDEPTAPLFIRPNQNPGRITGIHAEAQSIMKLSNIIFDGLKLGIENPIYTISKKHHFVTSHQWGIGGTIRKHEQGYVFQSQFSLGDNTLEGTYHFSPGLFVGNYVRHMFNKKLLLQFTIESAPATQGYAISGHYKGRDHSVGFEFKQQKFELAYLQTIARNITTAIHWVWTEDDPKINFLLRWVRNYNVYTAQLTFLSKLQLLLTYTQRLTTHSWWSTFIKIPNERTKTIMGIGLNYNFNLDKTVRFKLENNMKLSAMFEQSISDGVRLTTCLHMDYFTNAIQIGLGFQYM